MEEEMVLTITPSERTTLQLLATELTNDAVAARLGVHAREVDARLAALFAKMGVASRTEALADAVRRGLVNPASVAGDGGVRV
jgi:DNA-binding CsgD family transcriptional regulator